VVDFGFSAWCSSSRVRFLFAIFLLRFLLNRALSPLISDIVQLLLFVRRGVSPRGTRPTRMFSEESALPLMLLSITSAYAGRFLAPPVYSAFDWRKVSAVGDAARGLAELSNIQQLIC